MKKTTFSNVSIECVNEVRNAAFAKGINRDVNIANAKKILADIKVHGYRQAEMIQVIKAEEVISNGDVTLVDINDNVISEESAKNYFLILDGQHRVFAVSMFNGEEGITPIEIPAIEVELKESETIAQYITAINITKAEWKIQEYVKGAANVQESPLLNRYKELIKDEKNADGFPLSTLNLIFFGNSKAITKSGFSLLCQGKTQRGVKVKKDIIPDSYNIERGNKFIDLCLRKEFTMKEISKRYLAEQFSNLTSKANDEYAFEVFESITPNDKKAMYGEKGNFTEPEILAQFKIIKERFAKRS